MTPLTNAPTQEVATLTPLTNHQSKTRMCGWFQRLGPGSRPAWAGRGRRLGGSCGSSLLRRVGRCGKNKCRMHIHTDTHCALSCNYFIRRLLHTCTPHAHAARTPPTNLNTQTPVCNYTMPATVLILEVHLTFSTTTP